MSSTPVEMCSSVEGGKLNIHAVTIEMIHFTYLQDIVRNTPTSIGSPG